ncbi:MAG: chalcone isomerase family protein [Ectothiorhodospiraceae bacterium]|nr:chalcone isomerase family protein [Ectothiorhodospiraceae bacterium]
MTRGLPRGMATAMLMLLLATSTVDATPRVHDGARFSAAHEVAARRLAFRAAATYVYGLVVKVYVAGLYIEEGRRPAEALDDGVARRLEIEYLRAIDRDVLVRAAGAVLERNLTASEILELDARIARVNALYRDVRPGDRYALTYVPGEGTALSLNGETLGVVEGADFARAYFAIWLGPRPLSEDLRDRLLSGESVVEGQGPS